MLLFVGLCLAYKLTAAKRFIIPSNITIIALPPKFLELNPMENVWQFMHDNSLLHNRIFKFHGDLLEHCCEAWNRLIGESCLLRRPHAHSPQLTRAKASPRSLRRRKWSRNHTD